MPPVCRHFRLFWLISALFLGHAACAQDTENPAARENEAQSETAREITVFDVSTQIQQSAVWVREARARLEQRTEINAVRDALPELQRRIESLAEDSGADRLQSITRVTLLDLKNDWSEIVGELDGGQALLTDRLAELQVLNTEVASGLQQWRTARDNAARASAPPAVLERIEEVVASEIELRDRIKRRLGELLTLQNEVTGLLLTATAKLEEVEQAELLLQQRLVRQDANPLWALDEDEGRLATISEQLTTSKDSTFRVWRQFVQTNIGSIVVQFLVFVMLAWFALNMRRDMPADAMQHPRWLATRPFSLALLCSLLLTLWLYPAVPRRVMTVVSLLAMISMLRLIPLVAGKRAWLALVFMLLVMVIQQVRYLLPFGLEERLLLLFQTILSIVTLFAIHRYYSPQLRKNRFGVWGARLILVSLWAGGVSLLANVVGYVYLSRTITEAVVSSGFVAVAAYLAVIFLRRVVDYMIARRDKVPIVFVQQYSGRLANFAKVTITVLGILIWATYTLDDFGLQRVAREGWDALVRKQIALGSISFSLGQVVAFVITLVVAVLLSRLVRVLLERELFVRIQLPRGIPNTISTIVGYVIVGLGFLIAVSAAGMSLTSFGIIIGALGVGIGFGLQNVVNNFISGLILIFERPVQVGDRVQLGQMWGTVTEIGIRASTVKTFDGAEVIVPNGDLIAQQLTNWTRSDQRRRQNLPVKVAFGSDPRRVEEILVRVAAEHPETLDEPPPMALFDGTTETGMNFNLLWWVPFDSGLGARNDVAVASHEALLAAGIAAPIPVRRVTNQPPEAR